MRADRDAELRGQQQHRDHLVDAADAAGVDLADVDRLGLEELLEDHAVLHVLAGRDAGSGRSARRMRAWPSTSSGLVGSSIHHGSKRAETPHRGDRLVDAPDLVGVHHQHAVAARAPRGSGAARRSSASRSAPTFILTWREARRERLAARALDLLVGVAEPAGRGRVGRVARRAISASRAARCPAARRASSSSASSGVSASAM